MNSYLTPSTLESVPNGERYQDTGDGHLARFQTAADGVNAALRFQALLRDSKWPGEAPKVRIGLHQGHVTEIKSDEDGPTKSVGMPINLAARIMGLAQGGQILLTRAIFDDARQYVRTHPSLESDIPLAPTGGEGRGEGASSHKPDEESSLEIPELEWKAHGKYLLKGQDEPMEVFEVGAVKLAPFITPPDSEKATRAVTAEEEATLGWRPAAGLPVPHRKGWVLERKLGEGGFGEVWLASHEKLKEQRVYKFCFDVDRLRSFKREVTLFRLIRQALGDRKDIAVIHYIHLEGSPYFLELDYAEAGDLKHWAEQQGGIDKLPLQQRLDIVATIAEAVAAAHSVGIIHKDIKPSNILIRENEDGTIQPQLMDFGIGFLSDSSQLDAAGITAAGFTETVINQNESSRTGTRMYAPPETLSGKPFTTQGDIYSLGVMLYQMIIGDLGKPVASGWERDIEDELLREDIAECVAGEPGRRLESAALIAARIESLSERREIRRAADRAQRQRAIRRRLVPICLIAVGLFAVLMVNLQTNFENERGQRIFAEASEERSKVDVKLAQHRERTARQNLYAANLTMIQNHWDAGEYGAARNLFAGLSDYDDHGFEYGYWNERLNPSHTKIIHTGSSYQILAAGSIDDEIVAVKGKAIYFWKDMHAGEPEKIAFARGSEVTAARVSPNGTRIIALHAGGAMGADIAAKENPTERRLPERTILSVWDTRTRTCIATNIAVGDGRKFNGLDGIVFSADDSMAAVHWSNPSVSSKATNDFLEIWDIGKGMKTGSIAFSQLRNPEFNYPAFLPEGDLIFPRRPVAAVYSVNGKEQPSKIPVTMPWHYLQFTRDGSRFAQFRRKFPIAGRGISYAIQVSQYPSRKSISTIELTGSKISKIRKPSLSPSGSILAEAGDELVINLWDSNSGDLIGSVQIPERAVSLTFSPDGKRLIAGLFDGSVAVCLIQQALQKPMVLTGDGYYWAVATAIGSPLVAVGSRTMLEVLKGPNLSLISRSELLFEPFNSNFIFFSSKESYFQRMHAA